LDIHYDRIQLITGRPLWDQIDQQITNPNNSDAWAFVVSKHSLESAPCREELNYALQRALAARGHVYPLIGIFIEEIDKTLLPSAITTRLYVNIESSDWLERVRSGVEGQVPNVARTKVEPYEIKIHRPSGHYPLIVEARPRTGIWNPCIALVPIPEKDLCYGVLVRPAGKIPRVGGISFVEGRWRGTDLWAKGPDDSQSAAPTMSMYAVFTAQPTRLLVGPEDGPIEVNLSAI
jgi:hypothetical protein